MGVGGSMLFARGTRGLRRMEGGRLGARLARRTRTVKLCSFDARSKGQPCHSPKVRWRESEGPRLGEERVLARSGGRVRMGRAVEGSSSLQHGGWKRYKRKDGPSMQASSGSALPC